MSSPSRPLLFEPSPCRPRSALYSGLKRKCTSVLCFSLDSIITSPPLPPSPPEGPPRGTNFSRRNAMQPLPPSPAFTLILASSINIFIGYVTRTIQSSKDSLQITDCSDNSSADFRRYTAWFLNRPSKCGMSGAAGSRPLLQLRQFLSGHLSRFRAGIIFLNLL